MKYIYAAILALLLIYQCFFDTSVTQLLGIIVDNSARQAVVTSDHQRRLENLERMLRTDEPSRGVRSLTMIATAYTPAADEGGYLDALGADLVPYRTIAVDPSIIPLGSRMLVKYQGKIIIVGIARDTGSAIMGNRIDLCMPTKTEARDWGRKQVEVVILR
jgi:3D (Asp-Asp-Asp) domain-containing protein